MGQCGLANYGPVEAPIIPATDELLIGNIQVECEVKRACQWRERRQQKVSALQAELEQLEQRLARFTEENRNNPWPIHRRI